MVITIQYDTYLQQLSNNFLLQWGTVLKSATRQTISLNTSHSNTLYSVSVVAYWLNNDSGGTSYCCVPVYNSDGSSKTKTSIQVSVGSSSKGIHWQTFGY